jgi:hypothetical protein
MRSKALKGIGKVVLLDKKVRSEAGRILKMSSNWS